MSFVVILQLLLAVVVAFPVYGFVVVPPIPCTAALGMQNRAIPDAHVTASSMYDAAHAPYRARLWITSVGEKMGGWAALSNDQGQWLQINLGNVTQVVTRIGLQGREDKNQWVTSYSLQYSLDGGHFVDYQGGRILTGNVNRNTVKVEVLDPPIYARFIRVLPKTWHGHISMRMEVYGCTPDTFYISGGSKVYINEENKQSLFVNIIRADYGKISVNATVKLSLVFGSGSQWASSADCIGPATQDILFLVNETSKEVKLCTIVDDKYVEDQERFRAQLNVTHGPIFSVNGSSRYYYINSDDAYVRCANSTISISEEKRNVLFVLKREGVMNKAFPIWYSTVDGTACDKADYKPVNKKTVTFQPGQEYMTLSVEIVNDEVKEDDETFAVVIGSHVSTTLTSSPCTNITIKDNDVELSNQRQYAVVLISVAIGLVAAVLVGMLILVLLLYRVLHG